MVKKEYVAPALDVVEMDCVSVLANSFTAGTDEQEKNDKPIDTKHKNPFNDFKWE